MKQRIFLITVFCGALLLSLSGCGSTKSGAAGSVAIQSAPLAGPNAASTARGFTGLAYEALSNLLGEKLAQAAVSSFTSFKACNDTLIFLDDSGNQIAINGNKTPSVGQGLLTFSPTSQNAMSIGSLDLPANTKLSEVDITFAVVPSVCNNASYAVQFDAGAGPINITQNTAFKFKYASPLTITGSAQTISLQFGAIVNAMVSKGNGLNDSTIQTVATLGQAQ